MGQERDIEKKSVYQKIPQTHRQTEKQNTRFAWAGGTCPRFAWAGGTFFPVVLLCQFLVLAENRFWFIYYVLMYLEYNLVVVLC